MHEIEELASNIIFMIDGEIAYCGSLSNLKFETKEDNLERAIANLMRLSKINMIGKILKYQLHDVLRSKWIIIYSLFFL